MTFFNFAKLKLMKLLQEKTVLTRTSHITLEALSNLEIAKNINKQ